MSSEAPMMAVQANIGLRLDTLGGSRALPHYAVEVTHSTPSAHPDAASGWVPIDAVVFDLSRQPRCFVNMPPLLAPDICCRLVVAQRNESGVSKVVLAGPLEELELPHERRAQPLAV